MTTAAAEMMTLLDELELASDEGRLRRLDSAFARFCLELDPAADSALLLATALLSRAEGQGHSCLPLAALEQECSTVFPEGGSWQADLPASPAGWLARLTASPLLRRVEQDADLGQPLCLAGSAADPRLYLRRYWRYEAGLAQALAQRARKRLAVDCAATRQWLDRLFPASATHSAADADWQKFACALALRAPLTIITGGPGTGKTYTAARLLALLLASSDNADSLRIALAAPTGKAAARLRQAIDAALLELDHNLDDLPGFNLLTSHSAQASTVHALLGASADSRRFRHHAGNPLAVDVVIVDEASMVHVELMAALLDALPEDARLILLGDKDQLSSVEAGAVLGELCRDAEAGNYDPATAAYLQACCGEALPDAFLAAPDQATLLAQQTVMLRRSRRFEGPIGVLASAVNHGDAAAAMELLSRSPHHALHYRANGKRAEILQLAVGGREAGEQQVAGYGDYLQRVRSGPADHSADAHQAWVKEVLQAYERFRILCAVRDGDWGVAGLNRAIEQALASAGLLRPQSSWYDGRPVMVTRNNPVLGVFNGDIGIVLPAADGSQRRKAYFADGDQLRAIAVNRLAHVDTAFALTVHKSQGSEFEHTALVLAAHSSRILSRELVYTGITRARQACSLYCEQPGLLEQGIAQSTQRFSGLLEQIHQQ